VPVGGLALMWTGCAIGCSRSGAAARLDPAAVPGVGVVPVGLGGIGAPGGGRSTAPEPRWRPARPRGLRPGSPGKRPAASTVSVLRAALAWVARRGSGKTGAARLYGAERRTASLVEATLEVWPGGGRADHSRARAVPSKQAPRHHRRPTAGADRLPTRTSPPLAAARCPRPPPARTRVSAGKPGGHPRRRARTPRQMACAPPRSSS
jgi:hypothetical protein